MNVEYKKVLKENQEWVIRRQAVDSFSDKVSLVNIPGNDVFDSHDVPKERMRFNTAILNYNNELIKLHAEVDSLKNNFMKSALAKIQLDINDMIAEANLIFGYFEARQDVRAGNQMATMDRKFYAARESILVLTHLMNEAQVKNIIVQQEIGAKLSILEQVITGLIFIMILGIGFYGRMMSKRINYISQREEDQRIIVDQHREALIESAKMASLGVMAGGIAHELNNPLTIIFGRVKQLRRSVEQNQIDIETIKLTCQKIETTSIRMAKIIHGLFTFSRNTKNDNFRSEKLTIIIEDVLELCRERLREYSVELKILDIPEIHIDCRASEIEQVLLNLINNAVDATQYHIDRWVLLDFKNTESNLSIRITDSGAGIPREIADKIMHPFFTTKEVGKGTGLGLSISKGIIDMHNGSLSLDQAHAHTSFLIELPLFQKEATPILNSRKLSLN